MVTVHANNLKIVNISCLYQPIIRVYMCVSEYDMNVFDRKPQLRLGFVHNSAF